MLKINNRLKLTKLIVMTTIIALTLVSCGGVEMYDDSTSVIPAKTPPADWMSVATLAGATLDHEQSDEEIAAILNQLVEDGVSVVEADSRLSEYLTDAEFAQDLGLMQRVAKLAKERNLKIVWYYPSLEVITQNGVNLPSSMFKDHPNWVQVSADGEPNVFYGNKVFWVEENDESAWMEPLSEWRDLYINRVKQMAQTGIDGLWLDVPLYNDIAGKWASHHELSKAKFKNDTGYTTPPLEDNALNINDANTKVWLNWRHQEIDRFLKDVLVNARAINPSFNVVVETVTMDYNAAILEGLDGAFQGLIDGLYHVWEVDVVSDTNSMYHGQEDDYISLISMYKFGRGADSGRAAWGFSYGYGEVDAESVMAISVAAQVNAYELKSPEMTTTVGRSYRKKMFSWIAQNEDMMFRSTSDAKVVLLHSSASRDYIDGRCVMDGTCGVSLFASWQRPDPAIAWWTDNVGDSLYSTNYMSEYRGLVKALVNSHVPFDLLPSRLMTATRLSKYDTIVAPSLESLSSSEGQLIRNFVAAGGKVIFTAKQPGTLTELGLGRSHLFAEIDNTAAGSCGTKAYGNGSMVWCNKSIGKEYMVNKNMAALTQFQALLGSSMTSLLEAPTAGSKIYFEVYSKENKTAVHVVNYKGADGSFSVVPTSFDFSIKTNGRAVAKVLQTTPSSPTPVEVPFIASNDKVSISATGIGTWTLFIIEYN